MGCYRILLFLFCSVFSAFNFAYQPEFAETLPKPLKPWVDWVLYDQPGHECPFKAKNPAKKQCLWPSYVMLEATDRHLDFQMRSHSFAAGWLTLPGGNGYWPTNVFVNGKKQMVVSKNQRPALYMPAGRYQISGRLLWERVPASILIPKNTGLVALSVNNHSIPLPRRDHNGRVWLVEQKLAKHADAEDKLGISVYRHLQDGIPFVMETQVKLEVSGNPREALLGVAQLPGYELMSVNSPLPARIEKNGRLRVQLRPGSWTLNIRTRAVSDMADITLPKIAAVWPSEELWSFQPNPGLRLVRIEGAESVDPNQTNIPNNWKQWQAYRMVPGQVLKLITLRRGDPEPAPNQLTLARSAWVNFDGSGLVFQDQVNGAVSRDWRLNMKAPYLLGNAELAGEPQVVTEFQGSRGVELRHADINLRAVSYVNQPVGHQLTLPATGWQQDFENLRLTLNLPPGWQLLAASQGDVVHNAWLNQWQVWDVFLVLITTAALFKLRGVLVALLTAGAFVVIYPEKPVILWLWLNVMAVLALLSVLKPGTLHKLVVFYGRLSVFVLIFTCVPFLISQARIAIYPQLERGDYASATGGYHQTVMQAQMQESIATDEAQQWDEKAHSSTAAVKRKLSYSGNQAAQKLVTIDPNAAAQTGPSVPDWHWNQASIAWQGPVTADQEITLYLLKPLESRMVALLRVVLLIAIALGLFKGWRSSGLLTVPENKSAKSLFSLAAILSFAVLLQPADALASSATPAGKAATFLSGDVLPAPPLLETLKKRLLNANNCAPDCVAVNRARLSINADRMRLVMDVDALQAVQIKLPHAKSQWLIESVQRADKPAAIRREKDQLWIALAKGTQRIVMDGLIDPSQPVQLLFPEKVHNLMLVMPQWKVKGMDNGRITGGALYLEPTGNSIVEKTDDSDVLPPNVITPFVRVNRKLRLGLNWYVETRVDRLAPTDGAIKLQIPLLQGESVTTRNVKVKDGLVTVSLAPGQRQTVWYSSLEKQSLIDLVAPENVPWVETWQLENAAIWYVETKGLAAIKPQQHQQKYQPEWLPLPGDKLQLVIIKPDAAAGATTTIDQAKLTVRPGQSESGFQLQLLVRSSKGAEQRIKLNDAAKVLAVTVDGEAQPSQESGTHLVVPINPGQHQLTVQWREPVRNHGYFTGPDLEVEGLLSNIDMTVEVPRSQWVLFVGGPQLGPAVLIWGELLVIVLIALGLSRIPGIPLKTYEWVLLALGLCAGLIPSAIVVVLWFVAMKKRREVKADLTPSQFNLMQMCLLGLTVVALVSMLGIIPLGLMGSPDMGIVGNGSSHYYLHWYQDQAERLMPSFWWIALPLWGYRLLMLLWSLWLAVAILKWLKWAWVSFSTNGIWKKKPLLVESARQPVSQGNVSQDNVSQGKASQDQDSDHRESE
ncbi:MAG: hypothetical protein CSA49_02465 [Gammaproteobacteria bacterium]|nr:MAG: hypothetical protein CSA49_02465 [Gammaproteobacteria bacterium]